MTLHKGSKSETINMGKTSKRFSKERIVNGKFSVSMEKEGLNDASLVFTLKVENYSQLKKSIFYYMATTISIYRWRFELAKAKGTLFVILSANIQDRVVYFSVSNIDDTERRVSRGKQISDNNMIRSVYVSEFCNKAILDPGNKFLPNNILTVMCKYDISYIETIHILFPTKLMKMQLDVQTHSDYFKLLYQKSFNADFVLFVDDGLFRVHKLVLGCRSRFFHKLFEDDDFINYFRQEFQVDTVFHIMDKVLLYMYCGEILGLNAEFRSEILRVALKLQIRSLFKLLKGN